MKEEQKHSNNHKVTDMSYLIEFCEGDREKMKKYIEMFVSSVPDLVENVKKACRAKDYEEMASQFHGFKMRWTMMGMTHTKEIADEVEDMCKEGKEEEKIDDYLTKIFANVEKAVSELSES